MKAFFEIRLDMESASVLLRCLGSGQCAISQQEVETGKAAKIDSNINYLRSHVASGLAEMVLDRITYDLPKTT